ncbi:MAG: hypothetical protein ACK4YF_07235 [Exilispira sp.]
MIKEKVKLSATGYELFLEAITYSKEILDKGQIIHTRVFFPSKDKNQIYFIEQSKLIDELINKFNIKEPFENRNSEYFEFIKETALNIMRIKISKESPDHYLYISQTENNIINLIIRDPESFGITSIKLKYKNNDFDILKIENLPSNPYTNPMSNLSTEK